ncbi:MAG: transporter [Firmicutes bacterium]|nr:transporter [Bacillota bacterium]
MRAPWIGIAFTYVGAVVGAGFASGQEIYQFFTRFGTGGSIGIAIAGCLFALLGYKALERGRLTHAQGLHPFLDRVYPQWAVRLAEGMTGAFLLVGLGVVASGGGAAISAMLSWPAWVGGWLTLALVAWVTSRGTRAVLGANTLLVPYLLVMVIAVVLASRPASSRAIPPVHGVDWLLSALLYVSYNIFTGVMVLVALGRQLSSRRDSAAAACGGALLLTVIAYLEHRALLTMGVRGPLPLVTLARHVNPGLGLLFAVSLWIALFTTGVAEAYALRAQGRWWVLFVCGAGAIGLMAFDRMVAVLYPIMGLLAIFVWFPLFLPTANRHFPEG